MAPEAELDALLREVDAADTVVSPGESAWISPQRPQSSSSLRRSSARKSAVASKNLSSSSPDASSCQVSLPLTIRPLPPHAEILSILGQRVLALAP